MDNVEELLPIVYTPIEGDACEDYSEIFHNPNGLFISLKDKYDSFFLNFFLEINETVVNDWKKPYKVRGTRNTWK